jgi:nucleotide-binding universal stress UspA family protein
VAAGSRRVIAGVNGSVRSLAALRAAVAEARSAGAELLAVHTWVPVGGELAYMRAPCPVLLEVWEQAAGDRLRTAFDEAFGGMPAGLEIRLVIVRAEPGPALVALAREAGDLLVIGSGGRGQVGCAIHGSVLRYCLAHARCPVLAVPPPDMIRELRPWPHHWRPQEFPAPQARQ